MQPEIELIGRDRLLEKEIYPRTLKQRQFLLIGQHGIGKTALLNWSYHHNPSAKKAFVSMSWTLREIFTAIVKEWGIQLEEDGKVINPDRAKLNQLERAVLAEGDGILYIDDIQKATPEKIRRLRLIKERFTLYLAGITPFREELRPFVWGLKEIKVPVIPQEDRERLAVKLLSEYNATISIEEAAKASRGIPGRMKAMALANEVEDTSDRVEGEEIDISWSLLVMVALLVSVRYIGMGLGRFDLYVLGGLFMSLGLIFRFFLFRFQKK